MVFIIFSMNFTFEKDPNQKEETSHVICKFKFFINIMTFGRSIII